LKKRSIPPRPLANRYAAIDDGAVISLDAIGGPCFPWEIQLYGT
jgi:hypothetical protein